MTPLYLKHIALRQFRSFARLEINLPAEPGVLIVHGSNGLGKSSLFDALEWALSDRIDHFRDANGVNKPGTYLCRWREGDPGPTGAKMMFSDGNILERSLLSASSTTSQLGGSVTDITAFLRAPTWQQPISEIQRYLLLTHFLGQSTLSRLTHRKSTERFDILKEAAQSTSIEAVANSFHGQGNNAVVRAYARQVEALEGEAKSMGDLLEQEAILWAESQISGAIDDASVGTISRRIMGQLARAHLGDQTSADSLGVKVESTIEEVQSTADTIERECLAAEAQLEEARLLHSERQRGLAEIAEVVASRTNTQTRLDELGGNLEMARRRRGERRADVTIHQEALSAASTAVSRLRALRDARALVAKQAGEHRDSVAARHAAEQAKVEAERDITLAERRAQILQRVNFEIGQCGQEIGRLRASMAAIEQAIGCEARIHDQSHVLSQLVVAHPDINQAVECAEEAAAAAIDGMGVQSTVVEGLRDTVDAMSNAIATIAIRLPADACDCPLCATHFDSASVLQARVSTAAQRLAPVLIAQEKTLGLLSAARDVLVAELQQLRYVQSTVDSARALLETERQQLVLLLARLDGGATNEPGLLTARLARVADALAAMGARRDRKMRWQTHSALAGQEANVEHSRAVRARDAAQRTLDASTRRLNDLAAAFETAKVDQANAYSAVGAGDEIGNVELPVKLQEVEATLARVQEECSAATRALFDADSAVAALEAEQAGFQARLIEIDYRKTDLDHEQRRISDDWLALRRFGAAPDLAPVQAIERRISSSRLAVKEATGQVARLREGHLAWARQLSHHAVLEQIRKQVEVPPNETREQILASATSFRSQKQQGAEAVRQVKEIAKAASADISAELEEFNSEYIKPLGFLMSRINQAILCDPRVGIDLHVKKKRIEQSAIKGTDVPKILGEIDPLLVHSEGQLAAIAVSMLCAASLTFPWSRWKALVLDDPLQHNDSIHVAAFADLMSNLIDTERYQIFLSTHDSAQAEFLQRKFRSRRIPCTTLNLLGLGKNGVEWSVQSF
jgi:exonuclease SbcC